MKKRKSARLAPPSRGTIFIVDDDALLVEYATTVLEAAGYTVQHFSDPKDVLRAMQKANPKPAVLVTDYDMGEINGLELILSSHKIHAKVNQFLGKPYKPGQLQKIIAKLMQA